MDAEQTNSDAAPQEGSASVAPGGGPPAEAYVIPRALAQATVDYLASQPYREVFPLIRGFEALEPLPDAAGAS